MLTETPVGISSLLSNCVQVSESSSWLNLCTKDSLEKVNVFLVWETCFNVDIAIWALFKGGVEVSGYYAASLSNCSRDVEQSPCLCNDICELQNKNLLFLFFFFSLPVWWIFTKCISSFNKKNCKENVVQWVYNYPLGCGYNFFLVSRRTVLKPNCMSIWNWVSQMPALSVGYGHCSSTGESTN